MNTNNTILEKLKPLLKPLTYVLWSISGFVLLLLIVSWLFAAFGKPLPLGIPDNAFEPLTMIVTIIGTLASGWLARWGSTRNPPPDGHLRITVHEATDQTRGIAGATVRLALPDPKVLTTNDNGSTECSFPGQFNNQSCHINAEKAGYDPRQPETVMLGAVPHINLALARPVAPPPDVNPFFYSGEVPIENVRGVPQGHFFGRKQQIQEIKEKISTGQSVSLVGFQRSGRSSMLAYIEKRPSEFFRKDQKPLIVYLSFMTDQCATIDDFWETIRRHIEHQTKHTPWPSQPSVHAITEGLTSLKQQRYELVLLFDDFEYIKIDQFRDKLLDWRSKASHGLFAQVVATTRPIDDICREMNIGSPFGTIFTTIMLGAFEENEWHDPVKERFQRTKKWNADFIKIIDEWAGGLPFYTQMAASLLWEHGKSDKMRDEFRLKSKAGFEQLWKKKDDKEKKDNLRPDERQAIRQIANNQQPTDTALVGELTRYGIVRPNGKLFSIAFVEYVKQQKEPTV